jgi:L-ascorbate metabolism protein UlaG (beta-lactamase superfamily)
MAIEITWINHATFRLSGSRVVYIDPWKIAQGKRDGNVVFVSHTHSDHCSPPDVTKVLAPDGVVVGPPDVLKRLGGKGLALKPGSTVQAGGVAITGVPAYNLDKNFHPRANNWLGAVIEMDSVRVYYAGDTDAVPEMGKLGAIDLALLPVGGTYTMDAGEAAKAAKTIGCKAAIPYHFGDIVGSADDARRFASQAPCKVHVLTPGQALSI